MHWKAVTVSHKLHSNEQTNKQTDRILHNRRVYKLHLEFTVTDKTTTQKKRRRRRKNWMWHVLTVSNNVLNIGTEFDIVVVLVFDFYAICLLANDLPYFHLSLCYFEIPFIWYWYCLRNDNVFLHVDDKRGEKEVTKTKIEETEKYTIYHLGLANGKNSFLCACVCVCELCRNVPKIHYV